MGNEIEQSTQTTTQKAVAVGDIVTYKEVEWQVTEITAGMVTMKATAPCGSLTWTEDSTAVNYEEGIGTGDSSNFINTYCQTIWGDTNRDISAASVTESQGAAGVDYWIYGGYENESDGNGCSTNTYWVNYYVTADGITQQYSFDTAGSGDFKYAGPFAVWPIATLPSDLIEYVDDTFAIN